VNNGGISMFNKEVTPQTPMGDTGKILTTAPIGRDGRVAYKAVPKGKGTLATPTSTLIKVGINYPWKNYGWDFGNSPTGWSRTNWKSEIEKDIKELKSLGIFAVRWFLLSDGLVYGIGKHAPHKDSDPKRKGQWRFDDPPELKKYSGIGDYSQIKEDFKWLLSLMNKYNMKIVPSLIDFHWCFPGNPTKVAGSVKCGRSDILNDSSKRKKFFDRVLTPLLNISKNYKGAIYAWEIINEPEWVTEGDPNGDTGNKTVKMVNMKAFIKEGIGRINAAKFKSTAGLAKAGTFKNSSWDYFNLGITLHQFHYYPKGETLPVHTFSKNYPCFIGEFATAQQKSYDWPELKTDQSVYARLKLVEKKKYPCAFPWSVNANDKATEWLQGTKDSILKYTSGK